MRIKCNMLRLCVACLAVVVAMAPACVMPTEGDPFAVATGELKDEDTATFADNVPPEFQVEIIAGTADGEPTLFKVDDNRVVFPMPRDTRVFPKRRDMLSFAANAFGYGSVTYDSNGEMTGLSGTSVQIGAALFFDLTTETSYHVVDPMLAYLGGRYGLIEVDSQVQCIDPDGKCASGEYASYLVPSLALTRPSSTVVDTSSGHRLRFTSFHSNNWFFRRHGTNATVVLGAVQSAGSRFHVCASGDTPLFLIPSSWNLPFPICVTRVTRTRLTADGSLFAPHPFSVTPQRMDLSTATVEGSDHVETAAWSFPDETHLSWIATAICGGGQIEDSGFGSGIVLTGAGPHNTMFCN